MATTVRLVPMRAETSFAPLGVLGYCLTHTDFFGSLWSDLKLPLKTVDHPPEAKLLDVLVSILAGCRAISQVNTRIRPDLALARAWGRPRFAEQATLARTLDAFGPEQVHQLRQGSEALFRRQSYVLRHDFAKGWLWLDIDLTPLPISKLAEGSTKGKMGEKTVTAASWPACSRPSIMKPSSHTSIQASRRAAPPIRPCSRPWRVSCPGRQSRSNGRCCAQTLALAVTPTSTSPWLRTGRC